MGEREVPIDAVDELSVGKREEEREHDAQVDGEEDRHRGGLAQASSARPVALVSSNNQLKPESRGACEDRAAADRGGA
jgi:hypothetical protein